MYSRAWCCTSRGPQARAREIVVEARGLIGTREEGSNTIAQLWFSNDCGGDALYWDGEGGVVVYTLSAPVAIKGSLVYVSFPVSWGCVGW
jgi:hypothetical protein